MTTAISRPIRALIIDDSAYVRKVIAEILLRSPFIDVAGVARNGVDALEKTIELNPDVVILDLIMPEMDGLHYLRQQMARRRLPVIVLSVASGNEDLVMDALREGAVDFVQKPTALATDKLYTIGQELINKVKMAAAVAPDRLFITPHAAPHAPPGAPAPEPAANPHPQHPQHPQPRWRPAGAAIVIGISTGGPQALSRLIPRLPPDFPIPIAIVLHMPLGYTAFYAARLNAASHIQVLEAAAGDAMMPGRALLAPAGRHLNLHRLPDGRVVSALDLQPLDTPHRPSVDVLFHSASEAYGSRVVGIVMTGMGDDGAAGAAWIKAQGGTIIAEAESSCVVFGMPRSVVEAGLADRVVPLERMADTLLSLASAAPA